MSMAWRLSATENAMTSRAVAQKGEPMAEEHLPDTLAAMRKDYEGRILKITEICTHYGITRRRLYYIASAEGWRLRSPRRVDKNDLTQRLLRLLERQIASIEETMSETK